MHAASRHGTPSLTSLPKDGGVSCFLVIHLEGRPSSFWPYTAMLNFSEANGFGWTAWPLTPQMLSNAIMMVMSVASKHYFTSSVVFESIYSHFVQEYGRIGTNQGCWKIARASSTSGNLLFNLVFKGVFLRGRGLPKWDSYKSMKASVTKEGVLVQSTNAHLIASGELCTIGEKKCEEEVMASLSVSAVSKQHLMMIKTKYDKV